MFEVFSVINVFPAVLFNDLLKLVNQSFIIVPHSHFIRFTPFSLLFSWQNLLDNANFIVLLGDFSLEWETVLERQEFFEEDVRFDVGGFNFTMNT